MMPMQSDDVAEIVLFALTRPGRVNLNNVLVRPVEQAQ
jgi:NADP-dependent 3-hydroxy acid dehydrogenase YdfG